MDWTDFRALARLTSLVSATVILMSGCSVYGTRRPPLPESGPSMVDIYRGAYEHAGESSSRTDDVRSRIPLRPATEFNPGPTRMGAQEQIERRFPRVPNPDLVLVVFPHLSQGKYPIPGYVTVFPMYESTEYLLPGEVAQMGVAGAKR